MGIDPIEKRRMMQKKRIMLAMLAAFSKTGGIEYVSRNWARCLSDLNDEHSIDLSILSLHDQEADTRYTDANSFRGYDGNKLLFVLNFVLTGLRSDVVILTHINLALPALLLKLISPGKKLILITHGIEVWRPLSGLKERLLKQTDMILPVSRYTAGRLKSIYPKLNTAIRVMVNHFDPFQHFGFSEQKRSAKRNQLGLKEGDKLLITVCRLSAEEQYKGYDKVIEALPEVTSGNNIRYHIIGKYDQQESERIRQMITFSGLQKVVHLTGYVDTEELSDYYNAADLFIMPSKEEGFGIVFIEAMSYGLPVIAGNKDGSTEALADGALGTLADPDNIPELSMAISRELAVEKTNAEREVLIGKVKERFGFPAFKIQVADLLK